MSNINDTPPIGPHYARPKPVEAHSKQAGDHPQARKQDVLAIGEAQRRGRATTVATSAPSAAYLIILALVVALILVGTWWGGESALVGVGLGWVTGLLMWAVRKDLARALRDLFG